MRLGVYFLIASAALPSLSRAEAPVFQITPLDSKVTFFVKASVALQGDFSKWDATLTFTSPDISTGHLDIRIQAATVNTGSGMKNDKLKSKDFFDVANDPYITFKSTKVVQTGDKTFEVDGTFTIRGVSKDEKLTLVVERNAQGDGGTIQGTMAFDRKDYGMTSSIPFIKIADRVEVTVNLKAKRVSGPPVDLKKF
jgi:polyisoprenoid-binding protein YceI